MSGAHGPEDARDREALLAALAAERERSHDLQAECARLNGELGRLRGTLQEVRRALRLIFASWSWRLGAGGTRLVARVLRRPLPPSGQAYLEGLLGLTRDDANEAERLAPEARHGESATTVDWLVRSPRPLLAEGAPLPPPQPPAQWVPPLFEAAYLAQNPDALAAVRDGRVPSARAHWETRGRSEFLAGWRDYRPYLGAVTLGLRAADVRLAAACREEIGAWEDPPLITVLMPVYRVAPRWLEAAIGSVTAQLYPHWQLVIVDDGANDEKIDACLAQAAADARVTVVKLPENRGIAGASNAGLAAARGAFVALLDDDDELALDALWLVARVIREHDPDIVYSDEAKLGADGRVVEPHFKPGFSPEMIRAQNYVSHLGVYRRELLARIGGFRIGFEGAQDHDLLLRALGEARSIYHLPRILYYWRKVRGSTAARFSAKAHAWDAGVAAVAEDLERHGLAAEASRGRFPGTVDVRFRVAPGPPDGAPQVTVIVPFRDQPALLERCLGTLLGKTAGVPFEVLGVDNGSTASETAALMERFAADARVRFLHRDEPFNFSALNNAAAAEARGEHLLLLNNDVEITDPGWLAALLEHSQRPGVGAVGARLLYPDGTVQHAGVILGIGGIAGHSHKYLPARHPGHFCRPHLVQNIAAVTGACLLVKRTLYETVGGLEARHLGVAFNDVDFCLRLLERGYRNVYTPHAELIHHESRSRGQEDTPDKRERFGAERRYMLARHRRILSLGDPWYSPNLTLDRENFAVREAWTP